MKSLMLCVFGAFMMLSGIYGLQKMKFQSLQMSILGLCALVIRGQLE